VHGGGFRDVREARADRMSRLEELRRRWDEDHAKLKALVLMLKQKAAYNDGLASRYQAAQTRLAKFEAAGPPEAVPAEQNVTMRLRGGRTGKRAVVCERLELTGLMKPFDAEIWFGDRVAVLGSNGSGKSHFLRLLAAGGSDPDASTGRWTRRGGAGRAHRRGAARRAGAAGWFAQTHDRPELPGAPCSSPAPRHRAPARAWPRGGQPGAGPLRAGPQRRADLRLALRRPAGRFQILLLELSGATLLLLDEPTDNLDLHSAEALEQGLAAFEGTVVGRHPRPLVRALVRPVPRLRAPTARCTRRTHRSGTRPGWSGRAEPGR
jgi:ATPase subunit of ABC transporter with duplicated ATPase domains